MTFLIITLCVFNILMWLVFLVKFRKLFSTDDIIAGTKEEMNHIVSDINRNTSRNIDLINEKIRELKSVIAEADRHINMAKIEIDKQKNSVVFQNKLNRTSPDSSRPVSIQSAAEKYLRSSVSVQNELEFSVTEEGRRQIESVQSGKDFDDEVIVSPAGTQFKVERDGSSYASVPVIGPEVHYSDDPVTVKHDFKEQVKELHAQGFDAEYIASRLSRSLSEVQLVIDLGL